MDADPYKYFRVEARELLEGLGQGVLSLEKGQGGAELVGRLLRLAHTLKGAARVVRQTAIADRAHAVEDALALWRQGPRPPEQVEELLRLLDTIAADVAALDAVGERRAGPKAAPAVEAVGTIRIESREMDAVVDGVFEATVQLAAIRREVDDLARTRDLAQALRDQLAARGNGLDRKRVLSEDFLGALDGLHRRLAAAVEREQAELAQVREAAGRLRLVPASTLFGPLERAARDAAQAVRRTVAFDTSGGENRVDASVLASLKDALLHVVRNAVAHGIEPEGERLSAGKTGAGRLEITVERRGHRIAFLCHDDGRGVDVEAVRRAAVQRGLLADAEAARLSTEEALRLVLRGGLTTTAAATHVSGRGVGLDVVRETAARLKGEVAIRSEPGRGTTVEVVVPVSLSSMPALLLADGEITASLPLAAVRAGLRLAESDLTTSAEGRTLLFEGGTVPFLPLADALRRTGARDGRRVWTAVVLESRGDRAALGVERLLGVASIVVRSFPEWVTADPVVAGASLDDAGEPLLLLDPASLVAAARSPPAMSSETTARARPAVLVVDDSLTTRMLEQSILESAGYDVDLATSGEEALAKARGRRYRLLVVDVEMPGMDGFELLEQVRADPLLRDVPSILVTSRGSPEDRRRGEQSGARAYIVKSEFDQGRLLQTIRGLVGPS
jgi:two-component system chemotaxis sensor kinase CheA